MKPYEIRALIRKNVPGVYSVLAFTGMPFFRLWRTFKASQFKQRTTHTVRYGDHTFVIVLDPQNGLVDRSIFMGDVYEPAILGLIKKYLPVGGMFVDIGANIGQHSLFAASVVGDTGLVVSFEPIKRLVDQMNESIRLSNFQSRIKIVSKACGQAAGSGELHFKQDNIGGSSLVADGSAQSGETVEICVADEALFEYKRRVDVIKIDTEGYEPNVLAGLHNTIQRDHPVMIVEYSPCLWGENARKTGKDMLNAVVREGYDIMDIDEGLKHIEDINVWADRFSRGQTNLLMLPQGRTD